MPVSLKLLDCVSTPAIAALAAGSSRSLRISSRVDESLTEYRPEGDFEMASAYLPKPKAAPASFTVPSQVCSMN